MNKVTLGILVVVLAPLTAFADVQVQGQQQGQGQIATGGTGIGLGGAGGAGGGGGSSASNSQSSLNSTTYSPTTIDNRQPYSDEHLFAYPNGFGGYSILVKPGAPVQPVGPPSCGWSTFIANGQHC